MEKISEAKVASEISCSSGDILFYVCIPVYKVEKYIDKCIQSVLEQTYKNYRIVLVDDGSPDRCGEICDQYAAENAKIHVIHKSNMGLMAARRTALQYVWQQPGQIEKVYIVHLDSDDSLKNNALQVMYKHITQYQCDMVIYGFDRVMNGTVIKKFDKKHAFTGMITDKRSLYNRVFCTAEYNSLCKKAANLSLYEKKDYSGFYQIQYGEDLLQSLDLFRNCNSPLFIAEALYNYTVNPQSITRSVTPENYRVDSTVRAEVLRFMEEENVQTEQDIQKYIAHRRHKMLLDIHIISSFNTPFQKKVVFFNQILNDNYFQRLLGQIKFYEITLFFLQNGNFHLTILSSWIGYHIGRIGRGFQKIFRKLR